MKLIYFVDNECREIYSLMKVLSLNNMENPVIAVVGAGGKTRIVMTLSEEYKQQNRKAIITTSTHMQKPTNNEVITYFSPQRLKEKLESDTIAWVACDSEDGKISSPTAEMLSLIYSLGVPVIMEADGAKRLPCKAPAQKEPVIPKEADLVVGVLGMDAIGGRIDQVCHRPNQVANLLCVETSHIVTWQDLVEIAVSENGLRKNVADSMEYYIVFNKMNETIQKKEAFQMTNALYERNFKKVYFGVFDEDQDENFN